MRLFIAINFTSSVKCDLERTICELKKECVRGNFSRIDNLHLTLAFLGETPESKVPEILQAMKEASVELPCFDLVISGLGKFVNHGEHLYWRGVNTNTELVHLQEKLVNELKEQGISVDDKPFRPHITLGRRCVMKQNFNELEFAESLSQVSMKVDSFHLMLSQHIQGKLMYTSLGNVTLSVKV